MEKHMIYRILLILATFIFLFNLFIFPTFFDIESDNTGTFIGLIMIIIVIDHLLRNADKN